MNCIVLRKPCSTALSNFNILDNWRLPPLTVVLFAYPLAIEMFSIRLSEAKENRTDYQVALVATQHSRSQSYSFYLCLPRDQTKEGGHAIAAKVAKSHKMIFFATNYILATLRVRILISTCLKY